MPRKAGGLGRSLDIYYRDPARTKRMDHLNTQLVPKGALVFDIGAHVGDRTGSFLRLGARVIACEPQPRVFRALRLIHGRHRDAVLLCKAVGATEGDITLHLNAANPTISTVSRDLITAAQSADAWQGEIWNEQIRVTVTTLDQLVRTYGTPDFVKIDVEGHEAEVLAGLTTPLPLLSFEFTTIQRDVAYACIERLATLAPYTFNLSLGEDHALRHHAWRNGPALATEIAELPENANSGDIYARLRPKISRPS